MMQRIQQLLQQIWKLRITGRHVLQPNERILYLLALLLIMSRQISSLLSQMFFHCRVVRQLLADGVTGNRPGQLVAPFHLVGSPVAWRIASAHTSSWWRSALRPRSESRACRCECR